MIAKRKAAMGAQGNSEDIAIPEGEITLVDTDVESSTALWEWDATLMSESLLMHDEVLRSELAANGGFELLTEGDAFLVCFTEAANAVKWCMGVQEKLMECKWPEELDHNGNVSSSVMIVQGTTIFRGLRVRMGAHTCPATLANGQRCEKVSSINQTELMKTTRDISDFAMGGQVLLSNATIARAYASTHKMVDYAAVGAISKFDDGEENEEQDEVEGKKSEQISVIQALPVALKKRLPEFIIMYAGNEDSVRPPVGEITCVFTHCADGKTLAKAQSQFIDQVDVLDEILEEVAEDMHGYNCKGSAGKYLFIFQTPLQAYHYCEAVQKRLLDQEWPDMSEEIPNTAKFTDPTSGVTIFNGLTVGMGMHVGVPTMFSFNKTTARMDYFGRVVNRAARVMSTSATGEISVSKDVADQLQGHITGHKILNRGTFELKGIKEPMEISSILPVALEPRFEKFDDMRARQEVMSAALSPGALSPLSPPTKD